MLAAILEKVSGESLLAYLQSRLLEPMGISGVDWERSPGGICKGGGLVEQATAMGSDTFVSVYDFLTGQAGHGRGL